MKIKDGFILREVAGTYIALATGDLSKEYKGSLTLNSSAKFLFENMKEETTKEQLVAKMLEHFDDLDEKTATNAVEKFVSKLQEENLID